MGAEIRWKGDGSDLLLVLVVFAAVFGGFLGSVLTLVWLELSPQPPQAKALWDIAFQLGAAFGVFVGFGWFVYLRPLLRQIREQVTAGRAD